MTCSLETYRFRIGSFNLGRTKQRYFRKTNDGSTGSPLIFTPIFILLLLGNGLGLEPPEHLVHTEQAGEVRGGASSSCNFFMTTKEWSCSEMSSYIWDPGRLVVELGGVSSVNANESKNRRSVFTWRTKAAINKLAHIFNGNRENRGKGLTCIYWNKGPSLLVNKQDDILTVIRDHKPHIIGLGEANFNQGQSVEDVAIPGYILHLDSGLECGEVGNTARVAVYTHELIRVKRRQDLEDTRVAAVWLECGLPNQRGALICMGYRQWRLLGQDDDSSASVPAQLTRWSIFISKWEEALQEGKEVIVMLDANLDHLTWQNSSCLPAHHSSNRLKSLVDLLFEKIIPLGVSQLVRGATRFARGHQKSGLDHLYSNMPDKLSQPRTYFTGMSDHKLVKVIRYTKSFKQLPRYVRKRTFKDFNEESFHQQLSECNLEDILNCRDPELACRMLISKLTTILDNLAPITNIQVRSCYVPGLSKETKLLQKKRNEAQEKAASSGDLEDWRIFRSLRNQTTTKIREDKKNWEAKRFDDEGNSSNDVWKSVKGWLGWNSGGTPSQLFSEGIIVTRPVELATSMNKFFIKKIKDHRAKIPVVDLDPLQYFKSAMRNRSCTFTIKELSLEEVIKLIKGLRNSSATGIDFIDTRTVKLGAEALAPAIQHIINLSITTSIFPSAWKWHKVVPLLKSSDCDRILPKSYRPVALLPVISKILEKAVFNQLVLYLEQNDLVHPNLHGSRPGHSTATALSQLYDDWAEAVDQGSMVGVLLCDQSAAFDLCDHGILLEKLRLMGVTDSAAAWFRSYLSGRKQSCMVDGKVSAPLDIPACGVPQGSIGGPILWLIFTCDQPDVVHEHEVDRYKVDRGCSDHWEQRGQEEDVGGRDGGCGALVGYVDDGAYSFAHRDATKLSEVLTYKYRKLEMWMNANRLVINADKTHLMVMASRGNKAREQVSINAGGYIICPSETEKLLGGILHQSVTWKQHIQGHKSSLMNQLCSRLNGLKKVCVNASFRTRLMMANGVFMSKLSYLITLWGGDKQYLVKAVQVKQLAAARAVCGMASWRWSRSKLLNRVGWLSIKQLIFYHTVVQVHKTLQTQKPRPLFHSLSSDYPYRTRRAAAGQIRQDPSFSTLNTFKYRSMMSYNSVPDSVRQGSTDTVKTKLRNWIKNNIPID